MLSVGWTELQSRRLCENPAGGPSCYQGVYKNTGYSGLETIVIGFREFEGTLLCGWQMNCYTVWTAGQQWNANSGQHGSISYNTSYQGWNDHPTVPLMREGDMQYWFIANHQRVAGVIKTGATYQSFYNGFGNRMGMPSHYPYPYYCCGSMRRILPYSDTSDYHRFIISPYMYYHKNGGRMELFAVAPDNTFINAGPDTSNFGYWRNQPYPFSSFNTSAVATWPLNLGRDTNNKWILYPTYAISPLNGCMLALDGIYWHPGVYLQSEDVSVWNGHNYLITQNVFRTTNFDFMAMIME